MFLRQTRVPSRNLPIRVTLARRGRDIVFRLLVEIHFSAAPVPQKALEDAGASTQIVSLKKEKIKAWDRKDWGREVDVDQLVESANPENYDALLLPGGVMNPDKLRTEPGAVNFAKVFFEAHKPVAAICPGPWLLVEAGVLKGRKVTSWPSLRTDIVNAGGTWVDEEVVIDQGLVGSRKPADPPAFNKKFVEEIAEGKHVRQHAERNSDDTALRLA